MALPVKRTAGYRNVVTLCIFAVDARHAFILAANSIVFYRVVAHVGELICFIAITIWA